MSKKLLSVLMVCVVASAVPAQTGRPPISIGEFEFPSLRWGEQHALTMLVNNTDWVKFVIIETEISFDGSYLNPSRRIRGSWALPPGDTVQAQVPLLIPGNFGEADIVIRAYDVIDTLDMVLPSQKFFEQPVSVRFHIPEAVMPYMQRPVTVPPRVEDHPYFNTEFSRLLFLFLDDGLSAGQIADLVECDTSFVLDEMKMLIRQRYGRRGGDGFQLTIPVIRADEAEAARQQALALADTVASIIRSGMDEYWPVVDSLVAAGAITSDSNTFFDAGAVLYKPYPVVGALTLWMELGRLFITRSAPLLLYDGTDICNANIPTYMYAVEGGPVVNGTHFYTVIPQNQTMKMYFGDSIPEIICPEDFMMRGARSNAINFRHGEEYLPENFMMDTSVVRPMLNVLTRGADTVLFNAYIDLRDMAVDEYGHTRLDYGYRYWFWNLTATHALNRLIEDGVINRRGNGQVHISSMEF